MTTLYLAGPQSGGAIEAARSWDWDNKPIGVLVSFAYMKAWEPTAGYYAKASRFMLDSGAFTAYTTGAHVDIDALIAEVAKDKWHEAVGLDVIGDWRGSLKNMDYMLAKGGPKAMPVFHIGDPWDLLADYCARWPKVGLSCRFGEDTKTSLRFYEQCFARAWPHKFHSFGWIQDDALVRFPFHSADAATAVLAPQAYRNLPFKVRGRWVQKHLRIEGPVAFKNGTLNYMEVYWRLQQQLARKWSRELARLDTTEAS